MVNSDTEYQGAREIAKLVIQAIQQSTVLPLLELKKLLQATV
ncbi:hypothetical protein [Paenibacillus sp. DS2015]